MFEFMDFDILSNGEIDLVIEKKTPSNEEKGYVPAYIYEIHLHNSDKKIGIIDLRVGNNENTFYGGNIGYEVDEGFRGHNYAAKACKLIMQVARAHKMDKVTITCSPENIASRKTCEKAGAKFIEIVDLPSSNEMYKLGKRKECIYEITL